MLFLLGALAACLGSNELAHAGERPPVKVSATASKLNADGKQTVTITINIEKDMYIYANPVEAKIGGIPEPDFDDCRTNVTIKAKEPVKAEVRYPAGKVMNYGKAKTSISYNYYEKSVVIEATVQRTAGDTSPLDVIVYVHPWGRDICWVPITTRLAVK
jgi:Disulphide bond corrector protein DsbC